MRIILFNKPYGVLTQFTDKQDQTSADHTPRPTLADYISEAGFYPAGRLDFHSEGLLLLTDSGELQHQISHPDNKLPKTYWVQVEGQLGDDGLHALRKGVSLKDGTTQPAIVKTLEAPGNLWPRNPPVVAHREAISHWYQISISEGKNRQVRRMFAHIGHPVLRLIRHSIGTWSVGELQPGQFKYCAVNLPKSRRKPASHPRKPRNTKHKGNAKAK